MVRRSTLRLAALPILGILLRAWPAALVGAGVGLYAGEAAATISVPVTFEGLVERATAVAVVTPLEQHGVWEGGRIATYTRLHVERLVAGNLDGDIWVRAAGGAVGHIGQLVEGEATFTMGTASLVFVHPRGPSPYGPAFGVVEGAQGQFVVVTADGAKRLAASPRLGGLVQSSSGKPLARDVLLGAPLDDAEGSIARAWRQKRSGPPEAP